MDYSFEQLIEKVFEFEGGYSNRKSDKGGKTMYGITEDTWNAYCKKKGLPQIPVASISRDQAKKVYFENYWNGSRAAYLKFPLNFVLLDTAINFGVGGAWKLLNQALGLGSSMKWLTQASSKVHVEDPSALAMKIVALRFEHRGRKVVEDATQKANLKGWLNRDRHLFDIISKNSL